LTPHPFSTQRVCPPHAPKAGGYTLAGRCGGGGSIFCPCFFRLLELIKNVMLIVYELTYQYRLGYHLNNLIFTCIFGFLAISLFRLHQSVLLARLLSIMLQCHGKFTCSFERPLLLFPFLRTVTCLYRFSLTLYNKLCCCLPSKIFSLFTALYVPI
jgi:hypothetical protein